MTQKFHGIALANNSTAENFFFERLAIDPVVTVAGRLWFNTAEKVFKYSSLNALGAVVVKSITDSTDMAVIQAAIDVETAARIAALSAETTAREAADTALTTSVATANTTANSALAAVAAEATRAAAAEAAITAQVDNLVLASGDGSAALKTSLNARQFVITTTVPALEHVITHNLNTAYYLADIKVEGSDSIYRNDIVPVEEINANSFRITLSEARNVKVGVLSLSPIV